MASKEYSITITKRAEDNFDEICSYIALNSSHEQAENFLSEIINKIENLKTLPKKWRKIPELNDPNFRALITSAVSWILLLATPFAGFDGSNYYLGVYIYGAVNAWSLVGIPILINAIFLIYCTIISVLVLRFPDKIPDRKFVKYGVYIAVGAFILSIINGLVFAVVAWDEDWWWWFDAGFYGGVIGGLLTAILFYLGEKTVVL